MEDDVFEDEVANRNVVVLKDAGVLRDLFDKTEPLGPKESVYL